MDLTVEEFDARWDAVQTSKGVVDIKLKVIYNVYGDAKAGRCRFQDCPDETHVQRATSHVD